MKYKGIVFDFSGTLMDLEHEAFVPGALEFLNKYTGKLDFYICSAARQSELENLLEDHGIIQLFKKIYGGPSQKILALQEIIKDNGYRKEEIVFIGDGMHDYKAAQTVGCPFVGVSRHGQYFPKAILHVHNILEIESIF